MTLRFFVTMTTAIIMCLVVSLLLGYRYLFSLPVIEKNIQDYQTRELRSIKVALEREFVFFKTLNYDYSVWDDTYDFMNDGNQQYVTSNYGDDTFKSLKIDGVIIYDMNYKQVFKRAYNHIKGKEFALPELDLIKHPTNRAILPSNFTSEQSNDLNHSGFLNTQYGPVMFVSQMIKRPSAPSQQVGALVFIKKVRPSVIKNISDVAQVKLAHRKLNGIEVSKDLKKLTGSLQDDPIAASRQRALLDINDQPLMIIEIEHYHQQFPTLFDKSIQLTILMFLILSLFGVFIVNRHFITPLIKGADVLNNMLINNEMRPLRLRNQFAEVQVLIRGFNALFKQVTEQNKALEKMSKIDGLTQIYNRRAFDEIFDYEWLNVIAQNHTLTIMLVDVDFFKQFNDTYGHQQGDVALQKLARVLKDTALINKGVAARYGGEEFILLFNSLTPAKAVEVSEQLLAKAEGLAIKHARSTISAHLTVSLGCLSIEGETISQQKIQPKSAIKIVDDLLYQAKKEGRNQLKQMSI